METSSRATVVIEIKTEKNSYSFSMPIGAPLGEAYDAAHQIMQEIIKFAQNAAEQAKQKVEEAKA